MNAQQPGTPHTARPTATSPRTFAGLLLIALMAVVAALWAPSAGAQDTHEAQLPGPNNADGIPVDVVAGEGELGAGDVLHVPGDYVPAEGASITLADEDGTTGTLTDADNATLVPGAAGIGVMVEGEPTEVTGGDGSLHTTGLRAVSSNGIDRVEEAAASVQEEHPERHGTPADAEEPSEPRESPAKESEQPDPSGTSEADRIKQAVAQDMNERLSEAGMDGSGIPEGAPEGNESGSPSEDSAATDSTADDPASDDSGVPEPDESDTAESEGMFPECFPFCDVDDPGSSGADPAQDATNDQGSSDQGSSDQGSSDQGYSDQGSSHNSSGEDGSSESNNSTHHSETSEGGTTTVIESTSDQDGDTGGATQSNDDATTDQADPGQDAEEQDTTDSANQSNDADGNTGGANPGQPEAGDLLDNMNLLDPIGEDATTWNRSTHSDDGSSDQGEADGDTSGDDGSTSEGQDQTDTTPPADDSTGTEPSGTEPSGTEPSGTDGSGGDAITGRGAYCGEDFGGVQPHVAEVGCMVFDKFGTMDYSGLRPGDPQDHGKGLALDFMTYDDVALGDAIVDYGLTNQQGFAITYIIWQQQITFGSGWEMMEDRGNPTENHMDHPHFSFEAR